MAKYSTSQRTVIPTSVVGAAFLQPKRVDWTAVVRRVWEKAGLSLEANEISDRCTVITPEVSLRYETAFGNGSGRVYCTCPLPLASRWSPNVSVQHVRLFECDALEAETLEKEAKTLARLMPVFKRWSTLVAPVADAMRGLKNDEVSFSGDVKWCCRRTAGTFLKSVDLPEKYKNGACRYRVYDVYVKLECEDARLLKVVRLPEERVETRLRVKLKGKEKRGHDVLLPADVAERTFWAVVEAGREIRKERDDCRQVLVAAEKKYADTLRTLAHAVDEVKEGAAS